MWAIVHIGPARAAIAIDQDCAKHSGEEFRALITKAKVSKNDTRYGIIAGGPKYGLTPKQITQIRSAIGYVYCSKKGDDDHGFRSSGAVIGKSNRVIMTAHALMHADDSIDRDKCFFRTKSDSPARIKIEFSDVTFGAYTPGSANMEGDYAILNRKEPIPGATPLALTKKSLQVNIGDTLYVVSAQQLGMTRPVAPDEPIIQVCTATSTNKISSTSTMETNCSGTKSASGSIVFKKTSKGALEAIGMMSLSTNENEDSGPEDKANTYFILFDDKLNGLGW